MHQTLLVAHLFSILIMGRHSEVPIDCIMSFSTTMKQIFAMLQQSEYDTSQKLILQV